MTKHIGPSKGEVRDESVSSLNLLIYRPSFFHAFEVIFVFQQALKAAKMNILRRGLRKDFLKTLRWGNTLSPLMKLCGGLG